MLPSDLGDLFATTPNLVIHIGLVVVVPREGRVDLGERKMWKLEVHLFHGRAVCQLIQDNLDDLDIRVVDPGYSVFVNADVRNRLRDHGQLSFK